jgi:hypothetical protein
MFVFPPRDELLVRLVLDIVVSPHMSIHNKLWAFAGYHCAHEQFANPSGCMTLIDFRVSFRGFSSA